MHIHPYTGILIIKNPYKLSPCNRHLVRFDDKLVRHVMRVFNNAYYIIDYPVASILNSFLLYNEITLYSSVVGLKTDLSGALIKFITELFDLGQVIYKSYLTFESDKTNIVWSVVCGNLTHTYV